MVFVFISPPNARFAATAAATGNTRERKRYLGTRSPNRRAQDGGERSRRGAAPSMASAGGVRGRPTQGILAGRGKSETTVQQTKMCLYVRHTAEGDWVRMTTLAMSSQYPCTISSVLISSAFRFRRVMCF